MDQYLPPPVQATDPVPGAPLVRPAHLAAALTTAELSRPALVALHWTAATQALAAVTEEAPADARAHPADPGFLEWRARCAARVPAPHAAGYALLLPDTGPSAGPSWAADRYGFVYQAPARRHSQQDTAWVPAGAGTAISPLPMVARALAALAIAATGLYPTSLRSDRIRPSLLIGGDARLWHDIAPLVTGAGFPPIHRYRGWHPTRGSDMPLDSRWAGAPLVLVTSDTADACRDYPLRPGVVLVDLTTGPAAQADQLARALTPLDPGVLSRAATGHWTLRWLPASHRRR